MQARQQAVSRPSCALVVTALHFPLYSVLPVCPSGGAVAELLQLAKAFGQSLAQSGEQNIS